MAPGKGRVMREGRRKRVIVRVLVFGVVGVVLAFASALPVLWVREIPVSEYLIPNAHSAFSQSIAYRSGVRVFEMGTMAGPPNDFNRDRSIDKYWMRTPGNRGTVWISREVAVGWPLPILSGGFTTVINDMGQPQGQPWGIHRDDPWIKTTLPDRATAQGFPYSESEGGIIYPTQPIWRGLIGNTVFFGVIVWGVVALMGWCRRAIRRRRGRCEWCGYSLEGLGACARCPECGGERKATRPQAIEASS